MGWKHVECFNPPKSGAICMSDTSKADPELCFTWWGGSPANEPLPRKVSLAEDLILKKSIKDSAVASKFPLAPGHDMKKKKKGEKKSNENTFYHFVPL